MIAKASGNVRFKALFKTLTLPKHFVHAVLWIDTAEYPSFGWGLRWLGIYRTVNLPHCLECQVWYVYAGICSIEKCIVVRFGTVFTSELCRLFVFTTADVLNYYEKLSTWYYHRACIDTYQRPWGGALMGFQNKYRPMCLPDTLRSFMQTQCFRIFADYSLYIHTHVCEISHTFV